MWIRGEGRQAPQVWWEAPERSMLIIEGWAAGLRAEDCEHAVGLMWQGELVCPRYGVLLVGEDPWGVAQNVLQRLPCV